MRPTDQRDQEAAQQTRLQELTTLIKLCHPDNGLMGPMGVALATLAPYSDTDELRYPPRAQLLL